MIIPCKTLHCRGPHSLLYFSNPATEKWYSNVLGLVWSGILSEAPTPSVMLYSFGPIAPNKSSISQWGIRYTLYSLWFHSKHIWQKLILSDHALLLFFNHIAQMNASVDFYFFTFSSCISLHFLFTYNCSPLWLLIILRSQRVMWTFSSSSSLDEQIWNVVFALLPLWKMSLPGMLAPRKNRLPRPAPQNAGLAPPREIDKTRGRSGVKLTADSIDGPFSLGLQIMQ